MNGTRILIENSQGLPVELAVWEQEEESDICSYALPMFEHNYTCLACYLII